VDTAPFLERKITPKNQISVPHEYMAAYRMRVGEHVYIGPNPDKPGTLILVPQWRMAEIFEKGWTSGV
jgi:hypothetical protein